MNRNDRGTITLTRLGIFLVMVYLAVEFCKLVAPALVRDILRLVH